MLPSLAETQIVWMQSYLLERNCQVILTEMAEIDLDKQPDKTHVPVHVCSGCTKDGGSERESNPPSRPQGRDHRI